MPGKYTWDDQNRESEIEGRNPKHPKKTWLYEFWKLSQRLLCEFVFCAITASTGAPGADIGNNDVIYVYKSTAVNFTLLDFAVFWAIFDEIHLARAICPARHLFIKCVRDY